MLDTNLKAQLGAYLERVKLPFEITASLDDSAAAQEMHGLLQDIVSLTDKITLKTDGTDARKPSFALNRVGEAPRIRFAAIPMGHEFTSLVLALLQTGGHPPKIEAELIEQIKNLDADFRFETYMSLTCHNCPDVVQALNLMAVLNPRITSVVIDGGLYQKEVEERQILAVPMVFLNGEHFGQGRMDVEEIVKKLDTGAASRDAAKLNAKEAYDVLIVGGGPAGAAAAVYAARKGIRTGMLAERMGGQTMDTMSIENFISVLETDGPKFAAALEQHAKQYDVEILNLQRAEKLIPAAEVGGLVGVQLVEAAIDLAGIVGHVTLLEFGDQLRADAVLISKLKSLKNVVIHTQAQTTEITGADGKVNGLTYTDRANGESKRVELEGVFVQIGLVPNSEWLKGTLELSRHGEVVVDNRGQTSLPGVFAAGDVTTVPFKQIIIATGDGAKAALGAFDHLIRSAVPEAVAG
jgi:alkyl hydroperoxide reductase subunit F